MSTNYVDKMDNEPVGIEHLADFHTGKCVQIPAINEWGLDAQGTAYWWKEFRSVKCQDMYMSSRIPENSSRFQNTHKQIA